MDLLHSSLGHTWCYPIAGKHLAQSCASIWRSDLASWCCAALAAIPRGTLHVVLTKVGEACLALSKEAEAERDAAAAAVATFQEAATAESLAGASPRATAAAVNAQLRAAQPDLLDAGACWLGATGPAFLASTSTCFFNAAVALTAGVVFGISCLPCP